MAIARDPLENLHVLVKNDQLDEIRKIMPKYPFWPHNYVENSFRDAIIQKKIPIIQFFLDMGCDPTLYIQKEGERFLTSVLELAVETCDLLIVKLLIEKLNEIIKKRKYTDERIQDPLNRALRIAVDHGDLAIATYLLANGANANTAHMSAILPVLATASGNDNIAMVELLISYGAKVKNAVECAASRFIDNRGCDSKSVSSRLEKPKNSVKLLLDYAVGVDFHDYTLKKFLQSIDITDLNFIGVSIDGIPVTHEYLKKLNCIGAEKAIVTLEDLKNLPEGGRKEKLTKRLFMMTAKFGECITKEGTINLVSLSKASAVGDIAAVRARLDAKINPNEKDAENLHFAIELAALSGHLEIVKLLAEHPLIDPSSINLAYKIAFQNKQKAVVDFLKSKININLLDADGKNLLHHAIKDTDIELVKDCIEKNADVNLKTKNGSTSLQLLVGVEIIFTRMEEESIEILKLLLENGADPNLFDPGYYSPLELAAYNRNTKMVDILLPLTLKSDRFYSNDGSEQRLPWYYKVLFILIPYLVYDEDNEDILNAFKLQGARFDIKNSNNESLLHLAVTGFLNSRIDTPFIDFFLKLLNFLIENGADPNCINNDGMTPLKYFEKILPSKDLSADVIKLLEPIRNCLSAKKPLEITSGSVTTLGVFKPVDPSAGAIPKLESTTSLTSEK